MEQRVALVRRIAAHESYDVRCLVPSVDPVPKGTDVVLSNAFAFAAMGKADRRAGPGRPCGAAEREEHDGREMDPL